MAYGMGAGGGPDAGQMDAGEIEGPSSESSKGGGDTPSAGPSVGPGTGKNPDNPARGVSFDAPNLSGLMGGLRGMLGFESSSPVTEVNVETEATRTHPDEGLFGIQSSTLTSPGYTKAVDSQGKARSYNMARQHNLWGEFAKKAQSLKEQIAKEQAKAKKDWGKITALSKALQAIQQSDQYSKFMGLQNPALGFGAKAIASGLGLGVIGIAPAIENRAIELGFVDETTPDEAIEAALFGPQYAGGGDDFLKYLEDKEVAPLELPMALQLVEGQPE
jgi:hypothetical protein